MSSSTVIPVITFAAGLGTGWVQLWLGNRREDRTRFHADRLQAAAELLAGTRGHLRFGTINNHLKRELKLPASTFPVQELQRDKERNDAYELEVLDRLDDALVRVRLLFSNETAKAAEELVRVVAQAVRDRADLPAPFHQHADADIKAARISVEDLIRAELDWSSWWRRLINRVRPSAPADSISAD